MLQDVCCDTLGQQSLNSLNPHLSCARVKNQRPQTQIWHFINLLVYNSLPSRDFVAFQAPTQYVNLNPASCSIYVHLVFISAEPPIRRFLLCITVQSLHCTFFPLLAVLFSQHVYKYIQIYCNTETFIYRTVFVSGVGKFFHCQKKMSMLIKLMNELKCQVLSTYNLLGLLINANPPEINFMTI